VLTWLVAGVALAVALVAWRSSRNAARRVDQLTQMVWSLRYQYSELRGGFEGGKDPKGPDAGGSAPPQAPTPARDSFVPLSSLKQK